MVLIWTIFKFTAYGTLAIGNWQLAMAYGLLFDGSIAPHVLPPLVLVNTLRLWRDLNPLVSTMPHSAVISIHTLGIPFRSKL